MRAGILGFIFLPLLYYLLYAIILKLILCIMCYFALVFSLGIFAAPSHSFMYRFFPPKSRYRAVSLSYSIATATIELVHPIWLKF